MDVDCLSGLGWDDMYLVVAGCLHSRYNMGDNMNSLVSNMLRDISLLMPLRYAHTSWTLVYETLTSTTYCICYLLVPTIYPSQITYQTTTHSTCTLSCPQSDHIFISTALPAAVYPTSTSQSSRPPTPTLSPCVCSSTSAYTRTHFPDPASIPYFPSGDPTYMYPT